jgi:hypothetical protein
MTNWESKKSTAWGGFAFHTTRGQMKSIIKALVAAAGLAAFAFSPANAYEGGVNFQTKPGVLIGASAGVPPPGIYMFNQIFTYQSNFSGPFTNVIGNKNGFQAAVDVQGFLFVPGWTFLGATYDAVVVQPFVMFSVGQPLSLVAANNPFPVDMASGMHNTYIAPIELSWKLGTSGVLVKAGLGMYVPDGTVQGATGPNVTGICIRSAGCNGFANVGNKYWTFQPEVIFSYLGGGYNLSAAIYEELNTANQQDHYTQGNIFHADFTATKTIGKWTLGPVAYYYAQVSDDKCPIGSCTGFLGATHPFGTIGNTQRFQVFAAGGLIEYNFGPASLSVWATQEVFTKSSGAVVPAGLVGNPTALDLSTVTRGATVFATLSYRIWAPEEPAKAPMLHK